MTLYVCSVMMHSISITKVVTLSKGLSTLQKYLTASKQLITGLAQNQFKMCIDHVHTVIFTTGQKLLVPWQVITNIMDTVGQM